MANWRHHEVFCPKCIDCTSSRSFQGSRRERCGACRMRLPAHSRSSIPPLTISAPTHGLPSWCGKWDCRSGGILSGTFLPTNLTAEDGSSLEANARNTRSGGAGSSTLPRSSRSTTSPTARATPFLRSQIADLRPPATCNSQVMLGYGRLPVRLRGLQLPAAQRLCRKTAAVQ
jgi:hypothetical protein